MELDTERSYCRAYGNAIPDYLVGRKQNKVKSLKTTSRHLKKGTNMDKLPPIPKDNERFKIPALHEDGFLLQKRGQRIC